MRRLLIAVALLALAAPQAAWAHHDGDPIDDGVEDAARQAGAAVCESQVACFDYDDFEAEVMVLVNFAAGRLAEHAPDDADTVSHCAADDRGRPFACVEVTRERGEYRAVTVCARDPRRGRGIVRGWACARTEPGVEAVEAQVRTVDRAFCDFEPALGCSDYDETKADMMDLVDFGEDLVFRLANGTP